MRHQPALWASPIEHLRRARPGHPVYYFSPGAIQARARQFQDGFPGLTTYAVKANDRAMVLDNLATAGIGAFDVASPAEMAAVRRVLPRAVLHYHNPVRTRAEIDEGQRMGAASWSVDCLSELAKLSGLPAGTEIAVRLKLGVAGGAYDFGSKFGAGPRDAAVLLKAAAEQGFTPSITFHPGTQCLQARAWGTYIHGAAEVSRAAGVRLHRLNVGGGFPAARGGVAPDLDAIFALIARETRAAFGADAPALVCEPGRAMVADAFDLAVQVRALLDGSVFLNDGIYGNLSELRDLGLMQGIRVFDPQGHERRGPAQEKIVFGPTCDSLDRLPDPLALPCDMAEGDYLLFPGMGAYGQVLATRFNGYGAADVITVEELPAPAMDTVS